MKYRNYTDSDIINACKNSISYSEVLDKLNLKVAGGNYRNLQKNIDRLNINISHFKHQASNQGKEFKKFEDLIKPDSIKKRLIKYRGHRCQRCNNIKWLNDKIPLELHHIDGNNRNNIKLNLQLLCPNCHALTDNYRNNKR